MSTLAYPSPNTFEAVVIGAGLAGGASAYSLARRGCPTLLIDSATTIASKASGNRFGVITPYLSDNPSSPLLELYAPAFTHTLKLIRGSPHARQAFHQVGALQLPSTARLRALIAKGELHHPLSTTTFKTHRLTPKEASEVAGTYLEHEAIYTPEGGFISPRLLLEGLFADIASSTRKLTIKLKAHCVAIERSAQEWRLRLSDGTIIDTPNIVICGAHESQQFSITSWLPLEAVRGQTINLAAKGESRSELRCVVAYNGYITPAVDRSYLIGAHYSHNDSCEAARDIDSQGILKRCVDWLPGLNLDSDLSHLVSARVCFRTGTLDRLPYIGALPDYWGYLREASGYRSGSALERLVKIRELPGAYVNLGHGSRGLLSSPLGGEIVAGLITGDSQGADDSWARIREIVDPARVVERVFKGGAKKR
jgi:tRNA 5-methylaminomethyl-2-thiouridine biosynthesis bifunctional protein